MIRLFDEADVTLHRMRRTIEKHNIRSRQVENQEPPFVQTRDVNNCKLRNRRVAYHFDRASWTNGTSTVKSSTFRPVPAALTSVVGEAKHSEVDI
jgi:hypothetical protein